VDRRLLDELHHLDRAVYEAVGGATTPMLDEALGRLSRAADYSRLSLAAAAAIAIAGGPGGRRAAGRGLVAVALTASLVNAVMKPLSGRRRPDRAPRDATTAHHVPMPRSHSFPSGHAAAAFAFATAAGRELPAVALPLGALATLVSYSRIHTGVHYPTDVVVGALCGVALAEVSERSLDWASR
jgi:membrane-associated phospholipid phosphatase